jgi:RNA polymerase sigma-70 factor, ECF subfamily
MPASRNDRFSRLFRDSSGALKRYVQRLVRSRDTADEIVQEAFLRTYEHADDDKPPTPLLYSIAHNLAMDHHRQERRAQTETPGEIGSASVLVTERESTSLECWLLAEEQSSLLKRAVERLPPQCRAAFTLRVFHCCSYQEIAEKLGISQKTVEGHISRGMRETYRYLRQRYELKDVSTHHG